jgi:NAD(P)-dependent dehydrogenase (short-subunit alcohol dehydrogenase family)
MPAILITGAKGGLGAHITRAFLETGATVAGSSRSIAQSDFAGERFIAIPADLNDAASAARLADTAMERCGAIDALIHVAGGFAGGAPIQETAEAVWEQMMNLNARAAFHILRAVIPHMRRAGRGRIVAIGSRAAVEPAPGISAYNASKAALVALLRTAALENRDLGITANVILPGTMDTPGNAPDARNVSAARVAALAVFLASEAAAEISGAAIPVYGAQL